ncbi:sugar ABC transporter substrate-binding protein [Paenibacillus swuensis]|uniref:Sugar ABC transporter substrate-binding protein n=1 Tax=Paenibacillus swuensis TaxID=1178515 RepID=A0A172TJE9_9BACL|nr:extracellular solute-binding protein [Paenibacillus swuensis]ANE46923.1 sugar ABC transporter substrate-binding protein [Paenibacillus swuensis]
MNKLLSALLVTAITCTALVACSTDKNSNSAGERSDGVTTIEFWAAPNPPQQAYWKELAAAYGKVNPKVKIEVSPIKESPTSEASIQSALVGKAAPTMSENMNRGFAAQLANSKALVPLNTLEGFDEIIKNRNMSGTVAPWKFADGNQYVLPVYSNAMLFGWRIDILKEAGVTKVPQTYSEMLEATTKLKAKFPDKYMWAKPDLADPTFYMRWFDFFMLYNAASEGNKFIEGDDFVADDHAGITALTFMDDLRKANGILSQTVVEPFETGVGAFVDIGPWTFSMWEEKFPELKLNETFALSMPPVPDGMDPATSKTFADTKGLVIYAQASKAEQKAAFEFIQWVYANDENDVEWFETTKLPPARDDMTTNPAFKPLLEQNPELKPYAENVVNAIPPMDNGQFVDLQTLIGQEAFNKVVRGKITPEEGWANMKEAIEGVLQ